MGLQCGDRKFKSKKRAFITEVASLAPVVPAVLPCQNARLTFFESAFPGLQEKKEIDSSSSRKTSTSI